MPDDEHEPPPMPDEYWQALGLDPEVRHDDAPSVEPPPAVLDRKDPRLLPFFTFAILDVMLMFTIQVQLLFKIVLL